MKHEISSLIKRAKKYLKSAHMLFNEKDYESCVSRVYYAMFYAAEAALLTKKLSHSSHRSVISAFGEQFVKTAIFPKTMGREINRAFEKRQLGDYGHTFVITKKEAEDMLGKGEEFVGEIDRYLRADGRG